MEIFFLKSINLFSHSSWGQSSKINALVGLCSLRGKLWFWPPPCSYHFRCSWLAASSLQSWPLGHTATSSSPCVHDNPEWSHLKNLNLITSAPNHIPPRLHSLPKITLTGSRDLVWIPFAVCGGCGLAVTIQGFWTLGPICLHISSVSHIWMQMNR